MRVIAGEFRSRPLKSVPGLDVRPTPDRLREALFSILQPIIEGADFIDAYAGSGAVGIEALSRGARRVIFIERSIVALDVIKQNLAGLGLQARANIVKSPAAKALASYKAAIVFLDPPYNVPSEFEETLTALGPGQAPLVIVQHPPKQALEKTYGQLTQYRVVKQGSNCLSFYRLIVTESP